jgi:hypothetical protein
MAFALQPRRPPMVYWGMGVRRSIRKTAAVACVAAGWAAAACATQVSDLRVMGVRSNVFEFTFMSSMSGGKAADRLVFNHVSGATHVVRPGDRLGAYTVAAYTTAVERVLNPAVNAYQERKTGTVVLRDAAGRLRALKMGAILPEEGWSACLVAVDSGAWRYVVTGDELGLADGTASVVRVTEREVGVRTAAGEVSIVPMTEAERSEVKSRWAEEDRRCRAALAAATPKPAGEEEFLQPRSPPEPPASQWPAGSARQGLGFGTDFPYPVEYDVVSVRTVTPDGKIRMIPVVLPTRFQRRMSGVYVGR